MRIACLRTFFLAVFLVVLGLATAAPSLAAPKRLPLTPAASDGLTRALSRGELTQAEYALERAESLFHPARVSARYGFVSRPNPRDATMILRDLALRARYLSSPADQARAADILARPTDNPNPDDTHNKYGANAEATPVCGANVCIHYVTTGPHAVDTTDGGDAGTTPDYVDAALNVFQNDVWAQEVTAMGYRAPKSDLSSDNNGSSSADATGAKFDVYLADLGDESLYGYCTTDDPHFDQGSTYHFFDASSYCVVDNDFVASQFPTHTPLENLEVTAAHEFFHAVQFAYDAADDQWFMESTATWMEDEIYPDVNDNLQYLVDGPLGKPLTPLDKGATNSDPCCHVYGDWIFFRFVSEKFNATLIQDMWDRADGSADTDGGGGPDGVGPDDFSIQAVGRVLSSSNRGGFRSNFADFGWMNRIARVPGVYDEGQANGYPQSPLTSSANTLSHSNRSKSKSITLKHQANAYYEFKRGSGLSSTAKLTLALNLPAKSSGAAASVLVFNKNGSISPFTLGITSSGGGTFKIPFGSSVSKVDVVLSNGSTRYKGATCFSFSTPYACGGAKSPDDGTAYKFTAKV
jgi:hypothetical protein